MEILNPDHYLATLSGNASLKAEMVVKMGRGYVQAKKEKDFDQPEGTINIDAIYSPIKKVNYTVTHARVGQIADYDRLGHGVSGRTASQQEEIFMMLGVPPGHDGQKRDRGERGCEQSRVLAS